MTFVQPQPDTSCTAVDCAHDACRRERLVQDHLGLARRLARRFDHRGVPLEDLVQVASLALVKAAERFDESLGLSFGAYATPTITGEIKHHFRDRLWDLKVPRRVQDLHVRLHHLVDPLTNRLGRSPSLTELASAAGATPDEVLEALEAANAFTTRSIDAPSRPDDTHSWGGPGMLDEELEGVEERLEVDRLLANLSSREELVVRLRYFENMSQSDIAQRLGISQMHVSRLLGRSLAQLRSAARSRQLEHPDGPPAAQRPE